MQEALSHVITHPPAMLVVGAVLLVAVLAAISIMYLFAPGEEEDYEDIAASLEAAKKTSVHYWSFDSESHV